MPRQSLADMEESFLQSQGKAPPNAQGVPSRRGGRRSRPVLAIEAVTKLNTVQFYSKILTDELEEKILLSFITGMAHKVDELGKPMYHPDGRPVMMPVQLNPVSYKAFQRAVEYKRGMPVVTVKDDDGANVRVVEVITIGGNPEYFRKAAEAQKLLGKRDTSESS